MVAQPQNGIPKSLSLRSLFPAVSPEERPRLLFATGAFLCAASAGVVARTAGSTLFLSHFSASSLAPMYIASAGLLMAVSFGFGSLLSRIPLSRLLTWTAALLVLTTLLLRFALLSPWRGFSAILYLFSDLVGKLPALLFWSVAATMFDPRQAKRMFVLIGAGGTAACVIAGALIAPFTRLLGTENLLLVVAGLLFAFGAVIRRWLATCETAGVQPAGRVRASAGIRYYGELLSLPQVRHIASVAVLSTGALLLTDYLFKSSARAHYTGPALAGFFGLFYSASSLAALFVQLFVVHTVLKRGGVFAAASILPASLLIMTTGAALTGSFGWVIAAKFVDPVFDFTLASAAMQLLYLGIRKPSRSQARAFIEGFARPVAAALGGLFLFTAGRAVAPRAIAATVACAAAVWLFAAWRSYRSYVAGLLESIGVHRFDPADESMAFGDRAVETHIREALLNSSDEEVLYLLGITSQLAETDWRPEFRKLLGRDSQEIKVAALGYLSGHGGPEDLEGVCKALDHETAAVRIAAIHALASLAKGDAPLEIARYLDDPDHTVRAAATSEMINVGDLDALLAACINLKEMLRSDDQTARAAAAQALSRVTYAGLSKVLVELLADPDASVRRAALRACGESPDPRLIPAVLQLLSDPDLAVAAADTLAVFGRAVIPYLESFPDDVHQPSRDSLALVPQVLARTKDQAALPLLARALSTDNVRLRTRIVAAYCELLAGIPLAQRPMSELRTHALRELAAAQERAAAIATLTPLENTKLLSRMLDEERVDLLDNAFLLLGVMHPQINMRSILWVLRSGSGEKRAEALEVLDNVLDATAKSAVLAIFEPGRAAAPSGEEAGTHPVASLLHERQSEWIIAGAAFATGRNRFGSSLDAVRGLLGSPSPYVREAALDAISHLAMPGEVRMAAELVADDPSLSVRRLATRLLSEDPA